MKVILASKSPRRMELLKSINVEFTCIPSDKEEIITRTEPEEVVKELSRQKALDVESKIDIDESAFIIGADTIVSCDDKILGKPKNEQQAREMLKMLSGRKHQVYTGVTIVDINKNDRVVKSYAEKTDVYVKELSDDEITEYIATKEPMDKAGAYGIQGEFGKYVEKIEGDFNNVVGLPLEKLTKELFKSCKKYAKPRRVFK